MEWKTRPHLTLACFNDVNEILCIEKLRKFVQNYNVMPACIGSVGMFNDTKTIFLSPIMNSSLYQFQRELHEELVDYDSDGLSWYFPDCWVPHCTIALTGDDKSESFFRASVLLLREFKKISGNLSQ